MTFEEAREKLENVCRGRPGFLGTGRVGLPGKNHLVLYVGPQWAETSEIPSKLGDFRIEIRAIKGISPRRPDA